MEVFIMFYQNNLPEEKTQLKVSLDKLTQYAAITFYVIGVMLGLFLGLGFAVMGLLFDVFSLQNKLQNNWRIAEIISIVITFGAIGGILGLSLGCSLGCGCTSANLWLKNREKDQDIHEKNNNITKAQFFFKGIEFGNTSKTNKKPNDMQFEDLDDDNYESNVNNKHQVVRYQR